MLHCLRGDGCPCFREAVHIENKPLKALHLHKRQFYLSIKCIYFFIKLNEMKLPHSMPSVRKNSLSLSRLDPRIYTQEGTEFGNCINLARRRCSEARNPRQMADVIMVTVLNQD